MATSMRKSFLLRITVSTILLFILPKLTLAGYTICHDDPPLELSGISLNGRDVREGDEISVRIPINIEVPTTASISSCEMLKKQFPGQFSGYSTPAPGSKKKETHFRVTCDHDKKTGEATFVELIFKRQH